MPCTVVKIYYSFIYYSATTHFYTDLLQPYPVIFYSQLILYV